MDKTVTIHTKINKSFIKYMTFLSTGETFKLKKKTVISYSAA